MLNQTMKGLARKKWEKIPGVILTRRKGIRVIQGYTITIEIRTMQQWYREKLRPQVFILKRYETQKLLVLHDLGELIIWEENACTSRGQKSQTR